MEAAERKVRGGEGDKQPPRRDGSVMQTVLQDLNTLKLRNESLSPSFVALAIRPDLSFPTTLAFFSVHVSLQHYFTRAAKHLELALVQMGRRCGFDSLPSFS